MIILLIISVVAAVSLFIITKLYDKKIEKAKNNNQQVKHENFYEKSIGFLAFIIFIIVPIMFIVQECSGSSSSFDHEIRMKPDF